jgi:hypothetical protein
VAAVLLAAAALGLWQNERLRAERSRAELSGDFRRRIDSVDRALDSAERQVQDLQLALAPPNALPWVLYPGAGLRSESKRRLPDSARYLRLEMLVESVIPQGPLLVSIRDDNTEVLSGVVPDSLVDRSGRIVRMTVARSLLPERDLEVSIIARQSNEVLGSYTLELARR